MFPLSIGACSAEILTVSRNVGTDADRRPIACIVLASLRPRGADFASTSARVRCLYDAGCSPRWPFSRWPFSRWPFPRWPFPTARPISVRPIAARPISAPADIWTSASVRVVWWSPCRWPARYVFPLPHTLAALWWTLVDPGHGPACVSCVTSAKGPLYAY